MSRSFSFFVLFAIFWLFPLTAPTSAQADVITIVSDEWCPYNCKPGTAEPGFMIEIAQAIFAKHDHTIRYRTMPWSRAIEDTRHGKFTAIVGAHKKEAPDFIFPENFVERSGNTLFVKQGNDWKYSDIKSLTTKSVGVLLDYSYGPPLDDYVRANSKNPRRIQVASGDDALEKSVRKLLSGRLDVLVEDDHVMNYFIVQHSLTGQIVSAGNIGSSEPIHIAFSPANEKSKEYAKILSDGIVQMRASGELTRILSQYGLKPSE